MDQTTLDSDTPDLLREALAALTLAAGYCERVATALQADARRGTASHAAEDCLGMAAGYADSALARVDRAARLLGVRR